MDRIQKPLNKIGAFHLISTGQQSAEQLALIAEKIIDHVDALHLREKSWTDQEMIKAISLLQSKGVPLEKIIVNNRVAVAHIMKTKAVQLTRQSINVSMVKNAYPNLSLGYSIHSVEEAISASNDGADYLLYGHVYETQSKPGLRPKGLERLKKVVHHANIPVLAIGGITPKNTPNIIRAGASGIAVLSGVLLSNDPLEKVFAYKEALRKGGDEYRSDI
ncbi:thiamine phosphate synthase [Bacillus aquiflavi]|uniref:Thiamine phosphate synthase n=1 Tax=Bacillus aquiflavi TaxID=2672567 RepID=A0A6B3W0N3_9BACI|nr:thiamine phosphate synthase [Bacillus aquiflavi]MBA4537266.1 thiamine phosphate synthase [Bacillus aquiflavi]NEY81523.1 thiazole tautomerase TenI [Bacillus aquiflavi]